MTFSHYIKLGFILLFIITMIAKKSATRKIWKLDDDQLFNHLYDNLCVKSNHGQDMSKLNEQEKVFMAMAMVAVEVNDGGFDQYFFSKGAEWNDILVPAAKAIKSYEVAEICKRAVEIYEEHSDQSGIIEELYECDEAFYNCNDPYIIALLVQYAKENRKYFKFI